MCKGGKPASYLELRVEFSKLLVIELYLVVTDYGIGDTIPTNEVLLNEFDDFPFHNTY